MSSDYHYQTIKRFERINNIDVPIDECGHYLDWHDIRGNEACDLTSPYGSLNFAIGSGDDFHCFDYAELPDKRVVLHSVVNSETGGFIQDAGYEVVQPNDAVDVAMGFVDNAIEWLYQGGDHALRHTIRGWNQDEYYFVRVVAGCVKDPRIAWWRGARVVRGAKAHDWQRHHNT
jgi:hypothetical protein